MMNYLIMALAFIVVPLGIISYWQVFRFCVVMGINKPNQAVSHAAAKIVLE